MCCGGFSENSLPEEGKGEKMCHGFGETVLVRTVRPRRGHIRFLIIYSRGRPKQKRRFAEMLKKSCYKICSCYSKMQLSRKLPFYILHISKDIERYSFTQYHGVSKYF